MPKSLSDASTPSGLLWSGSLIDAIELPVWRIDVSCRIVELNRAARQLFQLAAHQPANDFDWRAIIHSAQRAGAQEALEAARSSPDEVACRLRFDVPGRYQQKWFRAGFRAIRAKGAGHIGWSCFARENHELVRRFDLFEQRDQQLRLALGTGEIGFWRITQAQPYQIDFDDQVRAMWAFPGAPAGLRMADLHSRIHPEDRDHAVQLIRMAFQSGSADGVYRLRLPDGSIRSHRSLFLRTVDPSTGNQQVIGVSSDITPREQARDDLRVSAQRLQMALAASGMTLFTMDRTLRFTWVHSADLFSQALVGKRDDERSLRPEIAQSLMVFKQSVLDSGIGGRRLYELTEAGRTRFVETTIAPQRDDQGRIEGLVGATFDVTRQRLAEIAVDESDRRKEDFLSVLAHELRNPLAPIRNALELLRTVDMPAVASAVMPVFERQVTHMARLIDDLLDVSRITTGRLQVKLERTDLVEIARRSADSYRLVAQAAGRRLEVSLPDGELMVDVDPVRIAQVIENLLNNALKFTTVDGWVRIEVCAEGDEALLRIIDNGIGFLDEQIPRMFEKFAQLPGGSAAAKDGLGVGLHLSQELLALQGGSISARSPGKGEGSEFTVRLPLRHRGAKVSTRSDEPDEQANEQATKQATKQANDQTGTSGLQILVVDDNQDVVETTSMLLQAWGHRTLNAHDGASGLALVASETPHAVLMDLGMPRIDGFEMARRIRELPGGKNVRLIAMSGWGQPADRERALAAGIDEHLVKPVDPTRLRELLDRIAKTRTNRGD
jgi:signal transduction histidine kinase/ActR/RegA family two-component response regulator